MTDKALIEKAVTDWLENHSEEERNKPYLSTSEKTYSMNNLIKEIKEQSEFGEKVVLNIVKLTIDLLVRNKIKYK